MIRDYLFIGLISVLLTGLIIHVVEKAMAEFILLTLDPVLTVVEP